jgi:hypothetical protein
VRSGKCDPDTVSRLYADSPEAKAEEAAQRKKRSDLDFAKCTFKPTIFGSGAKLLSNKAAAAAEGGSSVAASSSSSSSSSYSAVFDADADAAKARHDKLYEDNTCKVLRKDALAKKVQEEECKALTFKPVVNKLKANKGNPSPKKTSKYDQDGEEIKQPKDLYSGVLNSAAAFSGRHGRVAIPNPSMGSHLKSADTNSLSWSEGSSWGAASAVKAPPLPAPGSSAETVAPAAALFSTPEYKSFGCLVSSPSWSYLLVFFGEGLPLFALNLFITGLKVSALHSSCTFFAKASFRCTLHALSSYSLSCRALAASASASNTAE